MLARKLRSSRGPRTSCSAPRVTEPAAEAQSRWCKKLPGMQLCVVLQMSCAHGSHTLMLTWQKPSQHHRVQAYHSSLKAVEMGSPRGTLQTAPLHLKWTSLRHRTEPAEGFGLGSILQSLHMRTSAQQQHAKARRWLSQGWAVVRVHEASQARSKALPQRPKY